MNNSYTSIDSIIDKHKGQNVSYIDITDNDIFPTEYEKLQAAFPEAEIDWDVRIGDKKYSALTCESITLTSPTQVDCIKFLKNIEIVKFSSSYYNIRFNNSALQTFGNTVNSLTLIKLNLCHCSGITDLSPLSSLTNLQELDLSNCSEITDLSPMSSLTNLQVLNLTNCSRITDLSPLENLKKLQVLYGVGCNKDAIERFKRNCPQRIVIT